VQWLHVTILQSEGTLSSLHQIHSKIRFIAVGSIRSPRKKSARGACARESPTLSSFLSDLHYSHCYQVMRLSHCCNLSSQPFLSFTEEKVESKRYLQRYLQIIMPCIIVRERQRDIIQESNLLYSLMFFRAILVKVKGTSLSHNNRVIQF
jgi:hypothetical protein